MNLKRPEKKKRNPDRKQTAARLTVSWDCYDALDKVALDLDSSMSEAILALVKFSEEQS